MEKESYNSRLFAEKLKIRRLEKGMSMADVANLASLSPRTLSRIERGYPVSRVTLYKVLNALDLKLDDIVPPSASDAKDVQAQKRALKKKNVFVSYSHQDKKYLDRLLVHLKPLERKGLIDPWVDTRLLAGDRWRKEIEKALSNAKAAVLLVSADFLASDFIIENELPPLLQKANQEGTTIVPVILKPCRFARDSHLSEFQAINPPDEPVGLLDEVEQEMVFDAVSQRIEELFK